VLPAAHRGGPLHISAQEDFDMKSFLLSPMMLVLLAGIPGSTLAQAKVPSAPPVSGVLGQVTSVTRDSIEIQTKPGTVNLDIKQPLTTYRQVPSDLSHVTANSYVGVASEKQPNGTEVAKQILIFPAELCGAAEGSVLLDPPPGPAKPSRMTNGTVSRPAAAQSQSRMTNGVVQKGSATTLVVRYQDGSQTVSVPANVPVTEVAPGNVTLEAGDAVYAVTVQQPGGKLATSEIFVISGPAPKPTN
jgi:hypothetical protein